ncbi:MAG TPA: alpha-glucan family phosphorylase, partial [Acidimicrobiales bacterium]|nr:alpha-glucan family phosphorylase [Acidimicrobiales bacterium]
MVPRHDGSRDVRRAEERLARRLPEPLEDLAWIAYNYLWSWTPGGPELFDAIDGYRFELSQRNPVRFLYNLPERDLLRAATDPGLLGQLESVADAMREELDRPVSRILPAGPVAFMCAEFAVHSSLPVYSGGLGVLAGDYLKESSDQGLDAVGVGLMYRRGYLHQRMDLGGWQHEYWEVANTGQMPLVRVRDDDGRPVIVTVPLGDGQLTALLWRVDVGHTPLYLLDAEVSENTPLQRWVSARLYEGAHELRLAQYALLGIGGVKGLTAMGITPALYHLNEGHPALATLEVATTTAHETGHDHDLSRLVELDRDRFVFTTHTPVAAGNETYSPDAFFSVLGQSLDALEIARDDFAALARIDPANTGEPLGLSPLAIRTSRSTNAVSARHEEVAREMWAPLFPGSSPADVPISHVTNGVHLPTWMAPSMRGLLGQFLGAGWERRADDPETWAALDEVPDAELWRVRNELREALVTTLRDRVVIERLSRGEQIGMAASAQSFFDPDTLTLGFARRLATYKRLDLLFRDPERLLRIVSQAGGAQIVVAGKAHMLDVDAKMVARELFTVVNKYGLEDRVVFVEDYDLRLAPVLVAGCDVWINLPRPPMEASGTSGMKAAMNGGLNVSVMDGWWREA